MTEKGVEYSAEEQTTDADVLKVAVQRLNTPEKQRELLMWVNRLQNIIQSSEAQMQSV